MCSFRPITAVFVNRCATRNEIPGAKTHRRRRSRPKLARHPHQYYLLGIMFTIGNYKNPHELNGRIKICSAIYRIFRKVIEYSNRLVFIAIQFGHLYPLLIYLGGSSPIFNAVIVRQSLVKWLMNDRVTFQMVLLVVSPVGNP